jgi:uncharacterized protein
LICLTTFARATARASALATALAACALSLPAQGPQVPAPRGLVNDFANVIPAEDEARMERLIEVVRAGSRGEIAVVTLPDLEGRDVADVALRIGREWGVGAKAPVGDRARNAGVVVLLVPKESSQDGRGWIAIQVGQGAEGFITDAQSGDIRREATPMLAGGQYGPALSLVTARLAERYAAEFAFALDSTIAPQRTPAPRARGIPPFVFFILFFIIISIISRAGGRGRRRGGIDPADILLGMLLSGRGRRGGWGGGGFGGGGFGGGGFGGFGGGGGFSGGGSSGSF